MSRSSRIGHDALAGHKAAFLEFLRHNRNLSPHTVRAYDTDLSQLLGHLAARHTCKQSELTLAHFDATLRGQEQARKFMDGDIEAALAEQAVSYGSGSVAHLPERPDVAAALADNDAQFALVVNALGISGTPHLLARPHHGRWRLEKNEQFRRHLVP